MGKKATMRLGETLMKIKGTAELNKCPCFAWGSPGDVAIIGKAPEDINGRVCRVRLPDQDGESIFRLFSNGQKIRAYLMDSYELFDEYSADLVEVTGEVLAVVHIYEQEQEAPKATTAWEKRVKKAVKGLLLPHKDFEQIMKRHTNASSWETLNVAYCLGVETGRKEAAKNDKG